MLAAQHVAIGTMTHVTRSTLQFTQMRLPWQISGKLEGSCRTPAASKLPSSCPNQYKSRKSHHTSSQAYGCLHRQLAWHLTLASLLTLLQQDADGQDNAGIDQPAQLASPCMMVQPCCVWLCQQSNHSSFLAPGQQALPDQEQVPMSP
jgi:hypothetical protein